MSAQAPPPADSAEVPAVSTARWWTLGVACVATFMLMLDVTVVNVALPDIRVDLRADLAAQQWVIDAYTLALAAFLLTSGSLADRLGRRRVFATGLVVFTLASLAAGLSQGMVLLNVARGVQGVGAAVLFAVGPALIAQEFTGAERGKAFGLFGAVAGLALAFGPALGGLLAEADWRWIFLVNLPVGAALLVLTLLKLREQRPGGAPGVDWPGLVVFSAALVLLVLGFLRGEALGWTSAAVLGMFAAGVVLLVVFAVVERRRGDAAMLDLGLFGNRTFLGLSLATLLSNATSLAAIFLEVSYLQNVLGYTALEAGLRLLPLTLVLFVVAAVTGGVVTKVAPGVLIGTSILLIAVGMGLIALVDPGDSWLSLLPSMVVMGVGMGMFNPPRSVVSVGVVAPEKAGMATGIGETFQQVGVAIGVAAFGALFQAKVIGAVAGSGLATGSAATDREVGRAVAAGAGGDLGGGAEGARALFVDSFGSVMVVCAVICAVGAAIAYTFIRGSDLHESATAGTE
ncbi:MFS transporter [Actinokineospora globicatena]|uniref:MFS transporter n=1 Tax=Actinokineospora globicatena TaxID=103729 RepID=A0A9W6QHV0_9PSEU|nr:MFS transporter [Actinokineospora globicatena]GLW89712.1 MFS transporter [Actinokineospora globicatena]